MNRTAALAVAAALSLLPLRALAASSSEIAAETARNLEEGSAHVANFWWLPPEYWQQAAKELDLPAEDQAKVSKLFRDYVIVGALDADLSEKKKPSLASIADIVKRSHFTRDGQTLEVLREVNPEVAKLVPTLVYLLHASLGPLGDGLRLLPLANVSPKGDPLLSASSPGELVLQFRFTDDGPLHDVRWHAPLTSVAGVRKCPKGGEPLEASWTFCPWHGVKLEPAKP
ncbi:MAG: hypothetical protein ACHQ6T_01345 [Myxococcota bacterium]